jgi:type III secretion protein L
MTFLALHRAQQTSLATDALWLSQDDVSRVADATALLHRFEQLWATSEAEHRQALEQARTEGHAQGRAQALAEVAPRLIDAWDQASRSAQADVQALRALVSALAVRVTERLAQGLAPADVVAALARRASEEFLPDTRAVLRVHPDVAQAVRERLGGGRADGGLADDGATSAVFEVRADASLDPLDCVFETPSGLLLAGLRDQLSEVVRGWAREGASP